MQDSNTNLTEVTLKLKPQARILLQGLPAFVTSKYNMTSIGIYCLGVWDTKAYEHIPSPDVLFDEQETNLHFFPYTSVMAVLIAKEDGNNEGTQTTTTTG